jgi:hypothetical protein
LRVRIRGQLRLRRRFFFLASSSLGCLGRRARIQIDHQFRRIPNQRRNITLHAMNLQHDANEARSLT